MDYSAIMPRHLRIEYPGAIYHVFVRGNAKQDVFLDGRDRERFLERLAKSVESYEVRLYLYCLMRNHYHLLVETPKANISRFMQSVETGHTVYFNLKHDRSGHLTQGRFGAKLVEGDRYLLALARYLHLNPVRTKRLKNRPVDERRRALHRYRWSSYRSYAGLCREADFVDYGPMQHLVGGRNLTSKRKQFKAFVEAGLKMTEEELKRGWSESPRAIGSTEFLHSVDKLYQAEVEGSSEPTDIAFRKALLHLETGEILEAVCRELDCTLEDLSARRRGSSVKAVAARMLWRFAGMTKRQVACQLGLGSGAAVTWQMKKLEDELSGRGKDSKRLRKQVSRLESCLARARSHRSRV